MIAICRIAATLCCAATLMAVSQDGRSQGQPRPVVVDSARSVAATETLVLPGTVVANRSSRLSAAIGGLVKSVAVDFGARVRAGDTIVELDDAMARHDLTRAKAAVDEAVADAAEKRRLVRIGRNLNRRGVVTKDQLSSRRANAQIAQAVIRRLRAEQEGKDELLGRHRIVAPFDGTVASKHVEAGEWVSPGTPLVQLVADSSLTIDVSVPQQYYPLLTGTMQISLSFEPLAGRQYNAHLLAVSPVSDPVTRNIAVRVEPDDKSLAVVPGMSAQVRFEFTSETKSILVSKDAIVRQADGSTTVWIVQTDAAENGSVPVSEKAVQLGRDVGDQVVVLSGISADDKVVVSGNESLRTGQRVRVTRRPQ